MATVGGAGELVACLLPRLSRLFFSAALAAVLVGNLYAQRGGVRGAAEPPRIGKSGALYDITGYWVSVVTEDWDRVTEPDGQAYLLISATLEDPAYLAQPFVTASHFRKQADATGWNPTPCSAN